MSRKSTLSASSAFSSSSRPVNDPYKDHFDIWTLVKRKGIDNSFCMTSKFRMNHPGVRRIKSAVVMRQRKLGSRLSEADFEGKTSSSSSGDSQQAMEDLEEEDFFDIFEAMNNRMDFRRLFAGFSSVPNSRPVSADSNYIEELSESGTPAQKLYLKKCEEFHSTPSTYFARRLNAFAIDIPHHNVGPKGAEACAIALSKTSTVHVLNMNDNGIGPDGAKYMAAMLRQSKNLSDLSLADNNIGVAGIKHILKVIYDLDNLTRLDLSNNGLQDNDAELVKEMIEDARNLRYLNLSHNEFRETGGQALGAAISWNEGIQEFDLSWNHFRRAGSIGIAQGLEENTTLKTLNISWNGFYLEGCKTLATVLPVNTTLTELDLSSNRINRECLGKLTQGLAKNQTLEILKLAHNPITSTGAFELLRFIAESDTTGINVLDLGQQQVELSFATLLAALKLERDITVIHGTVLGQMGEGTDEFERDLLNENPSIVLIEFGQMMGFRLIDLFSTLDKDGSRTLDKQEITKGLKVANIPLGEKSIEHLFKNLDTNQDGVISYGELLAAQQAHRKLMMKMYMAKDPGTELELEETEIWRIRSKLQALMAHKMGGYPSFRRQSQLLFRRSEDSADPKLKVTLTELNRRSSGTQTTLERSSPIISRSRSRSPSPLRELESETPLSEETDMSSTINQTECGGRQEFVEGQDQRPDSVQSSSSAASVTKQTEPHSDESKDTTNVPLAEDTSTQSKETASIAEKEHKTRQCNKKPEVEKLNGDCLVETNGPENKASEVRA